MRIALCGQPSRQQSQVEMRIATLKTDDEHLIEVSDNKQEVTIEHNKKTNEFPEGVGCRCVLQHITTRLHLASGSHQVVLSFVIILVIQKSQINYLIYIRFKNNSTKLKKIQESSRQQ
ncbi:unnamed protein product [Rotaria magnacalcarata]|uniref:Uncharacterized protein n=2 Tax=Rotaria magnacalcarata TaxID=392030 RepID=A0A815FGI3_9BILA|nr:unnamed protein product [Rotaria magnacalcarata]